MDSIDDLAKKIDLNKDQADAVKKYIVDLLLDTFKSMKEEYDTEIDKAIESLSN